MNFKTQEEKTAALFALPSSPPAGTGNVDEWIEGIEKQQKEIENATVGESAAEVKDSPKPPEGNLQQEAPKPPEQTSPEPTDSQADGVFQFTIKKDELPPELKAYKSPDEILKQFAHARSYANKAEETVKRLQAEKDALLAQREVLVKPPDQKEREIETQVRDIQKELDFSKLDDDDYIPGKQFKEFNKIVLEKLEQAEKKYHDIANEFASIKTDSNKRSKELEEQRLLENTKRGIDELLEKNPELKASKPLFVLQANDSVEADVAKYADRILMSKYGNDKPTWQQRNAVINAVLSGDPEITAYCSNNALTPESVGTTIDDVRK
ncbi:MAG: hypothetical protein PHV93_05160, partial [Candidatus Pacebacteria bacterium]|nr:hypothetical protein [Candidatus Paceibacterota bacterium]